MGWNNVIPGIVLEEIMKRSLPKKVKRTNKFYIKQKYLVYVSVEYSWGEGNNILGSVDHPSFKGLRDLLERRGFIETKRNECNGDSVLRGFYLNDVKFTRGQRFLGAGAMGNQLSSNVLYKETSHRKANNTGSNTVS